MVKGIHGELGHLWSGCNPLSSAWSTFSTSPLADQWLLSVPEGFSWPQLMFMHGLPLLHVYSMFWNTHNPKERGVGPWRFRLVWWRFCTVTSRGWTEVAQSALNWGWAYRQLTGYKLKMYKKWTRRIKMILYILNSHHLLYSSSLYSYSSLLVLTDHWEDYPFVYLATPFLLL